MSEFNESEFYAAQREESKQRRKANRENGAQLLREAGIPFKEHNNGAHLIVCGRFDFFPGTGLWKARTGGRIRGRGVRELIKRIRPTAGGNST